MSDEERKGREVLEAALSRGLLDQEQFEECLRIAGQLREMGLAESLPDIAVKKDFFSAAERDSLVRELEHDEKVFPFEIQEEIGRGANGVVYRAVQKSLERPVALKVLKPGFARDPKFVEQFLREAKASAKFNHVNIVQGIDAGEYKDSYFFAMELVDGPPLGEILRKRKRLRPDEAMSITLQVARALEFAEKLGLVHRDIKPDNILVDKDGTAKLGDLGMARLSVSEDVIKAGVAVGTPYYMSPEQARGQTDIDIRSDLYSLGATLYHMLTGEPPFKGKPVDEVLRLQLTGSIPDPREKSPQVSAGLANVVAMLMARDRRRRYHSPLELQRDLELVSANKPSRHASRFSGESTVKIRIDAGDVARKYLPYAAVVLGVVLVAAVVIAIGVSFSANDGGEAEDLPDLGGDTAEVVDRPEEREPPVETPQPEEDEMLQLKRRYDDILTRIAASPQDFQAHIRDLQDFITEAGASPYRVLAEERLKELQDELAHLEKERLGEKRSEVLAMLEEGRVAKARERVHELFPPDESGGPALQMREELFKAVGEAELAVWKPFSERIDNAVQAKDFEAARRVVQEASSSRYRFIRDRATLALKRIAEEEEAWGKHLREEEERARKQRKQEVEKAFDRFFAEYAALFSTEKMEEIHALVDKYEAGFPELSERLKPFRDEYPGWLRDALTLAMKGLASRDRNVSMTWRGQPLKGRPVRNVGDTVFVRTAGGPELPVKAEDLSVTDLLTFGGLLMPQSRDDRLKAAALTLVRGDSRRFERYLEELEGPEADVLKRMYVLSSKENLQAEVLNMLARADKAFEAGNYDTAERVYREFVDKYGGTPLGEDRKPQIVEKVFASIARGEKPFEGVFEGDVKPLGEDHFVIRYDYAGGFDKWAGHLSAHNVKPRISPHGLVLRADRHARVSYEGLGYIRRFRTRGSYDPLNKEEKDKRGWAGLGLGDVRFRFWGGGGGAYWMLTDDNEWDNATRENFRPQEGLLGRFDFEALIEDGKMKLFGPDGKVATELDYKGPGTPALIELSEGNLQIEQLEVEGFLAAWYVRMLIVRNHYREARSRDNGLRAAFFRDRSFRTSHATVEARTLDFTYPERPLPRMPEDGFSIRMMGMLVVPDDGEYTFICRGNGMFRLVVDGKLAVFRKPTEGDVEGRPVRLKRGVAQIIAEYVDVAGEASNRVEWKSDMFERRSIPSQAFLVP